MDLPQCRIAELIAERQKAKAELAELNKGMEGKHEPERDRLRVDEIRSGT